MVLTEKMSLFVFQKIKEKKMLPLIFWNEQFRFSSERKYVQRKYYANVVKSMYFSALRMEKSKGPFFLFFILFILEVTIWISIKLKQKLYMNKKNQSSPNKATEC